MSRGIHAATPWRPSLAPGLALILVLGLGACGQPEPPARRPHVIVVVADALRADHLPLHGYSRPTAPALSAWAQHAVVFDAATAPSNWTRPSVLALLTGRHPPPGLTMNPAEAWPRDAPRLPELLADQGYETIAVVANPFLSRRLGADRGFSTFVSVGFTPPEADVRWKDAIAAPFVLDRLEYVLSSRPASDKPVFLYVHLMDPHLPYDPPAADRVWCADGYNGPLDGSSAPYLTLRGEHVEARLGPGDQEQITALYDGEIRRLDRGLERLRALVDQWLSDRPRLHVLTADHGEAFGEGPTGHYRHGNGLGPELLHIPLIVSGPGFSPRRETRRVGLVDLAPTILTAADCPIPTNLDGHDLHHVEAGRTYVAHRALPGQGPASGELAVLQDHLQAERTDGAWTLVDLRDGRPSAADPTPLIQAAEAWIARAVPTDAEREAPLDEAITRQLQALGYADG